MSDLPVSSPTTEANRAAMLPMLLSPEVGHRGLVTRQLTVQENILRFPALRGIMMRCVKDPAETECATANRQK